MNNFAKGLHEHALFDIQIATQSQIEAQQCFNIFVYAGITEAKSNDALDNIVRRAKANQRIIALHRCEIPEVKV